MAKLLNSNSAYFKIFTNLSMKFNNQNSLIFNSMKLTILSQVTKLNSIYIFIL